MIYYVVQNWIIIFVIILEENFYILIDLIIFFPYLISVYII